MGRKFSNSIIKSNQTTTHCHKKPKDIGKNPLPVYLIDRENTLSYVKNLRSKEERTRISNSGNVNSMLLRNRSLECGEKYDVFRSGKRAAKYWKRSITNMTVVGRDFVRKHPKYERFI